MPGKWGYIGGGAALLCAGIIASRADLLSGPSDEASPPAVAARAPAPAVTAPAPQDDQLARLGAELAAREAENAELRTTLAVRDAVLETLKASLAERDTAVGELQARLAASDAEIAALRRELAALAPPGWDAKRAVFAADAADTSAARVEAVRVALPELAAGIADGAGGAGDLPLSPADGMIVGSVAIHFDFASSRLTPGGQIHAAAAAVTLAEMPLASVRIVGHTDRVGNPAANRRLAARRARAVADFLVASGLPRDIIAIDGMGEADLPVPTADGVPEPLNRTVAIIPIPRAAS
jgi:outer membrane protein OmpA-like peptidoglycan-associated protein